MHASDAGSRAEERERVLELVRRHGWNTTSFQALEEGLSYRFDELCDACTAYADTGSAWVAAGAPIAAEADLGGVADRFVEAARAQKKRASFFASQERFAALPGRESVQVGAQPVWDPSDWPRAVAAKRSLRAQIARAANKGVVVRRVEPHELESAARPTRAAIERLIESWRSSRRMAPLGFLVSVEPFAFAHERALFVAERDGRIVGFLSAVPVYARNGWFLEDIVRAGDAPNGTNELLVDAAMRSAAREGRAFLTLGLAPLAGPVPRWMKGFGRLGRPLYDFAGLHAFKQKLAPSRWEPVYVTHGRDVPAALAVLDALRAFAGGSLAAFALRTLLLGPAIVAWILALALAPWTVLLAIAESDPWFPSQHVHVAWVAFDAVLFVALLVQGFRPRRTLLRTLAVALTLDAALTFAEVAVWNVPRVRSAADVLMLFVACAGPALAATLSWSRLARGRGA